MAPQILLEVQELRYTYGNRKAVDGVSFGVFQGETLGLLGPNGAGKTTTIQCVAGLKRDWAGQMLLKGTRFAPAADVTHRRHLGFVPQELAIYEGLTARENLRLFAQLSGLKGDAIDSAIQEGLDLSGLNERADEVTSKFSGGMKRRLNLAIGQVHSPSLLLLDEPTVGVDPQSRNHLFESLERLRQRGMTLIYTTHYMEEAERLCDRIAIMNEGQIIAIGTTKELAQSIDQEDADLEAVFLQLTGRSLRDAG